MFGKYIRAAFMLALINSAATLAPALSSDDTTSATARNVLQSPDSKEEPLRSAKAYRERLKNTPDDALRHYNFGIFLIDGGIRIHEGMEHLRKAALLEPSNTQFRAVLMNKLVKAKDYAGAAKFAKELGLEQPVVGDFPLRNKRHPVESTVPKQSQADQASETPSPRD